ncbi:MAG TPA: glutathione S-transferase N-terminal domain-containing protein, partial [Haliangium sp.]|nr:glutathione S-transferase N-terminal domain-containing protein [Haliangium sp.]
MTFQLVIGNRNYSSWSLRAWLFLRESGIAFEEIRVPLYTPEWAETVARYSPTGRVPVLLDGDLRVWDTVSIIEYVRERHPQAVGWPAGMAARAEARSIA